MTASQREPDLRTQYLDALKFRCIGPHRGGRVVAVAGDASNPSVFYFGACAGGVWKTTDAGTYWHNVSDGFFKTAAIGAMAVSESDPNVIYAGTGETDDSRQCLARRRRLQDHRRRQDLDERRPGEHAPHRQDPRSTRTTPTSSMSRRFGHAWGPNEERGVYRSKDGGATWEKVLYKSERAGSHDSAHGPAQPAHPLRRDLGRAALPARARSRRRGQRPLEVHRRRRHLDRDHAQPGSAADGRLRQDRRRRLAGAAGPRLGAGRSTKMARSSARTTAARPGSG